MSAITSYDISKDFRFKQARIFLKEKNYDDSIDLFVSLLKSCEETYGESSPQAAAAWYEYGNVLLLKEEENPANGVLGNVQADPSEAIPEDDDVGEEDGPEGGSEPAEGEVEGEVDEEDEPEGDLQIAWEALDVARSILTKQDDAQQNILLSDVYMRLGDLNRFNDNIAGALEEYQSALFIRNAICEPYESAVSDSHFSLAVAYIYNAAEDTVEDPVSEKKKALVHYKKARESIVKWIEVHAGATTVQDAHFVKPEPTDSSASSSSSGNSCGAKDGADAELEAMRADKAELADMLQETIDALKIEIDEMEKGNALNVKSAAGVTTIGFGQPSSSSSSSAFGNSGSGSSSSSSSAIKTVNVISAASSSSGFSAPSAGAVVAPVAEVNTLQVKRKKRPLEEDTAAASASVKH